MSKQNGLTPKELAKQYHDKGLTAFQAIVELDKLGYDQTTIYADAVLRQLLAYRNRQRASKTPRRAKVHNKLTWQTGMGTADLPKAEYNRVPKLAKVEG